MAKGDGMTKELERYVGTYVTTKVAIPSDRRGGGSIPAGTDLFVLEIVGTEHFNLVWSTGGRAASQVHYTKLKTA